MSVFLPTEQKTPFEIQTRQQEVFCLAETASGQLEVPRRWREMAESIQPKRIRVPPARSVHPAYGKGTRELPIPATVSFSPRVNAQDHEAFGEWKNPSHHQQQSFVQTGVGQQVWFKPFLIQIWKWGLAGLSWLYHVAFLTEKQINYFIPTFS